MNSKKVVELYKCFGGEKYSCTLIVGCGGHIDYEMHIFVEWVSG